MLSNVVAVCYLYPRDLYKLGSDLCLSLNVKVYRFLATVGAAEVRANTSWAITFETGGPILSFCCLQFYPEEVSSHYCLNRENFFFSRWSQTEVTLMDSKPQPSAPKSNVLTTPLRCVSIQRLSICH